MLASLENIRASIAAPQAGRFRNRQTAAASAPSGLSDRLKPGADLTAAPALFIANLSFATGAVGGSWGTKLPKWPSVISVTYGVVVTDARTCFISTH